MSFGEDISRLVSASKNGLHSAHETWARVRLGEVAQLTNGFPFKSAGFSDKSGMPIVRIRDVVPGVTSTFYSAPVDDPKMTFLDSGDIAIGMDGDFNCRVWKGGRALLNQRVCTLMADERYYNQQFLAFALPGYLQLINEHTSSITVKHLSSKTVQDIPLPLPPLAEQERIVEKIETLFAELDKGEVALRSVQKLLARYRQSVLKAAVTGTLTADTSVEWPEVRLGELLLDIRYGTAKKCHPDAEGIPVLRIPNIVGGSIDLNDLKFTELTETEMAKLALREGDVLLVRSNGSASLVGRGAVVTPEAVGLAYAGYLIRVRVDQNRLLPAFLQVVLSSPGIRAIIERQAKSTSGVHNLNSAEVKAISFRLPPLAVQEAIVAAVDEMEARASNGDKWCSDELRRSAALRQSILKDAFAGKLVPQDPTDEPAADLLVRIRASHGTATKRSRKKASA